MQLRLGQNFLACVGFELIWEYVSNYLCRKDSINILPKSIRNCNKPTKILSKRICEAQTPLNQLKCDAATGLYTQNPECAARYHGQQFSIWKNYNQFHLAAVEAIFIKTQKAILCRQKEYACFLQILQ